MLPSKSIRLNSLFISLENLLTLNLHLVMFVALFTTLKFILELRASNGGESCIFKRISSRHCSLPRLVPLHRKSSHSCDHSMFI